MRDNRIRQRASDLGLAPDRFTDPKQWKPVAGEWRVHFRKIRKSPLRAAPLEPGESWVRIGDFEVARPGLSRRPE